MAERNPATDGVQSSCRRGFNIPKLNKAKSSGILEYVSRADRESVDLLKDVDHTCFFSSAKYKKQWRVDNVRMVRPTSVVEEPYRQKLSDLERQHGNHLPQEVLGFYPCNNMAQARKIAQYGIRTMSSSSKSLGNPAHGVYLYRHVDVSLSLRNRPTSVFVFKVILGRTKRLPLLSDSSRVPLMEPTPHYDSHLSHSTPHSDDALSTIRRKSQMYLYEYTDDAVPTLYPRQCLPFALLEFVEEDRCKRRGNSPVHSENTSSCEVDADQAPPASSRKPDTNSLRANLHKGHGEEQGISKSRSKVSSSSVGDKSTNRKTSPVALTKESSSDAERSENVFSGCCVLRPPARGREEDQMVNAQNMYQETLQETPEKHSISDSAGLVSVPVTEERVSAYSARKLRTAEGVEDNICNSHQQISGQDTSQSSQNITNYNLNNVQHVPPLVLNFQDPRFYQVCGPSDFSFNPSKTKTCPPSTAEIRDEGPSYRELESGAHSNTQEKQSSPEQPMHPDKAQLKQFENFRRDQGLSQQKKTISSTQQSSKGCSEAHSQLYQQSPSTSGQGVMDVINELLAKSGHLNSQKVERDPTELWGLTWNEKFDVNNENESAESFQARHHQTSDMTKVVRKEVRGIEQENINRNFKVQHDVSSSKALPMNNNRFICQSDSSNQRELSPPLPSSLCIQSYLAPQLNTGGLDSSAESESSSHMQATTSSTSLHTETNSTVAASQDYQPGRLNMLRAFTQLAIQNVGLSAHTTKDAKKTIDTNLHDVQSGQRSNPKSVNCDISGSAASQPFNMPLATQPGSGQLSGDNQHFDFPSDQKSICKSLTYQIPGSTSWLPSKGGTPETVSLKSRDDRQHCDVNRATELSTHNIQSINKIVPSTLPSQQRLSSHQSLHEKECQHLHKGSRGVQQKNSEVNSNLLIVPLLAKTKNDNKGEMYESILSALQDPETEKGDKPPDGDGLECVLATSQLLNDAEQSCEVECSHHKNRDSAMLDECSHHKNRDSAMVGGGLVSNISGEGGSQQEHTHKVAGVRKSHSHSSVKKHVTDCSVVADITLNKDRQQQQETIACEDKELIHEQDAVTRSVETSQLLVSATASAQVDAVIQNQYCSKIDCSVPDSAVSTEPNVCMSEDGSTTLQWDDVTGNLSHTAALPETGTGNQSKSTSRHSLPHCIPTKEHTHSMTENDQNSASSLCDAKDMNKEPSQQGVVISSEHEEVLSISSEEEHYTVDENARNTALLPESRTDLIKKLDENDKKLTCLPDAEKKQEEKPEHQETVLEKSQNTSAPQCISQGEEQDRVKGKTQSRTVVSHADTNLNKNIEQGDSILSQESFDREHSELQLGAEHHSSSISCVQPSEKELATSSSESNSENEKAEDLHTVHADNSDRAEMDADSSSTKQPDGFCARQSMQAVHKTEALTSRPSNFKQKEKGMDVKRPQAQNRALPLSTLGLNHWMEALMEPSLNPQLLLVDIVQAYVGKADFDNCTICQKVVDSSFLSSDDEDQQMKTTEAPQNSTELAFTAVTSASHSAQAQTEDTSSSYAPVEKTGDTPKVKNADILGIMSPDEEKKDSRSQMTSSVQNSSSIDPPSCSSVQNSNDEVLDGMTSFEEESVNRTSVVFQMTSKDDSETLSKRSAQGCLKGHPAELKVNDMSAGDSTEGQPAGDQPKDQSPEYNMKDLPATEDSMKDLPTEYNMKDLPATEDSMKDLPATEDSMKDLSATEDSMKDLPAEDNIKDLSAPEYNMKDLPVSAEDNLKDLPTEDSMKDLPTEDSMKDLPTEYNMKDLPTEDNMKDLPTEDSMKDLPTEDSMKDLPTEDSMMDLPTEDSMKDLPTEDSMKDLPTEDNMKDLPTEDNMKDLPTEDNMKDLPTEDNMKDLPTEDSMKDLPTEDSMKDLPTEDSMKDLPTEDNMKDLPTEDSMKDLPTEDNLKDLPTEDNLKDLPTEDNLKDLPTEDNLKDLPTEDSMKDLPTEDNPKDLPTEDSMKDLPTEDNPKDLPTEDNMKDLPTEDNMKDLPTEDNMKDLPTEDSMKDLPTEDSMKDLPTEDSMKDLPTEDSMMDLPTEDSMKDLPTEDNMKDLPTEDNMKDLPTEDNMKDLPTEDSMKDLPTEDSMKDLPTEDSMKDLPTEDNPKDLPTEDNMKDLPTEDNPKDLPTEDNPKDLPTEENLKDLPTEDNLKDLPTEDNLKDLPTEDNLKDLPTEDSMKDLPTEDNLKDLPTEDNMKDLPTEDNMKDLPTEDNMKDLPTEDNMKDLPTENNMKDLPTEDNMKDLPTEDNMKDLPTEDSMKDLPTEDNMKDLPTEDNMKDLPTEDNMKDLSGHVATDQLELNLRDASSTQASKGQSADVMTMEQSADDSCEQDPTSCNLKSSLLPIVEKADGDVMPLSKQKDRSGWSTFGFFNSRRRYGVGCSTGNSFPRNGRLPPSPSHRPRKHVQLCRERFSVNMEECFDSPEVQNDAHFEKDIAAGSPIPTLASGTRETHERRKCLHQLHMNKRDQVSHGFHIRQSVYYKSATTSSTLSQHSVEGCMQHEAISHPSYYHQYLYETQLLKSYKTAASEHEAIESLHQDSSRRDMVDYFQDIIGEKRKAGSDKEPVLESKRLKRDLSARDRHGLKQKRRESGSSKTNSASFDRRHECKRKAASSEALRRNDSENRSSGKRPKVSTDMEKGGAPSKSHVHRGHDKLSKPSEKGTSGNKPRTKKSYNSGMKKVSDMPWLFSDPQKMKSSVKSGQISVDKRSQERAKMDKSRFGQIREQRKNGRTGKDDRVSQRKGLKLSSDKHYTQRHEKATMSTVTRSEENLYCHTHSPQGFSTDKADERSFHKIQSDIDTFDLSEIDRCSLPLPGTLSAVSKDPGILENHGLSSQSQENTTCKRSQSFRNEVHQEESATEMCSVVSKQEPDTPNQDLGLPSHDRSSHQSVNAITQGGETNRHSEALILGQRRDYSEACAILKNTGKFHGLAKQKELEVADLNRDGSLCDLQSHEQIKNSSAGRTGLSRASACGRMVPDSKGDACFANCVNHAGEVKQIASEERESVQKSVTQRPGDIQPQEEVACCTSQASVLSADPIVSVPAPVDTKGDDASAVSISDNLALPLKKESFTGEQINLELEIISGCLRLLEACREDGQADSTLKSLPMARLSDAEVETLRMSLCAVLKDFRHSIECIRKGLKGKPHHCMPQELLLREERNQLYTREGVFAVLVSSIPLKSYKELLKIKAALEDVKSGGTSDQSKMPDQIDQIQQRRKSLMESHTGKVRVRLLNELHKQVFSYTVCRDHMIDMLGHESVTEMVVFRSSFEAVQHHLQLVKKELRIAECTQK